MMSSYVVFNGVVTPISDAFRIDFLAQGVQVATITITKAVADSQADEKRLLFVPGALVAGIEAADPMIAARSAAYIVSLSRRAQGQ